MKRLIYLLLFLILPLCGMTGCALDESVSSIAPKVGDAVYAKNEKNGQTAYKPVTAHYHNNYTQAVYLTIAAPDGKTQTIVSNAIHPFLAQIDGKTKAPTAERHRYQGAIPNAQWIAASDLRAGYRLLGDDENWHTVQHVKTTLESLKAYNLTVADYRTFFIKGTEGTNGVWVHNDCWNILPDNATRRNIGGKEVYTFTDKGKTVHVVENKNWKPGGNQPKYLEANVSSGRVEVKPVSTQERNKITKTEGRLPQSPNFYVENLIKDRNGNYIGKNVGGATENIRTLSEKDYQALKNDILKNSIPGANYGSKGSKGTWYDLPGGGRVGVRISNNHGETIDFDVPGIPTGFKIHKR